MKVKGSADPWNRAAVGLVTPLRLVCAYTMRLHDALPV